MTPADLPEWSYIRTLEPSPYDPATCYLAATRYKLDDNTPYLYKTADYGETWSESRTASRSRFPAGGTLRSQPAGGAVCGQRTGLYVLVDDGASWQRWGSNVPVSPIYDLKIKDTDLILATHGRGFWITEDLPMLYQFADQNDSAAQVRLFAPRQVYRVLPDLFADWVPAEGRIYGMSGSTQIAAKSATGQVQRSYLDAGEAAHERGCRLLLSGSRA